MVFVDTDILVDVLRGRPPAVQWLHSLGQRPVIIPGFSAMEILQGCRNREEQLVVERELRAHTISWPSPDTCDAALDVFAQYHLSHGLGLLDALIGQMAVSLSLPVHTFNRKHFACIPGTQIVEPYQRG